MPDDEPSQPRPATVGAVLALLTLLVFWQLLGCSFVYFDDNSYVTSNAMVRAGLTWAGIKWAFYSTIQSNWHPLTWISHMLDCQLYGLKPLGPHYTNLLLHIANTLLLFTWLRRLTGAVWRSALVAALFAWHPLHVESVAWVSERKDVLSTFFWMLTLIAYDKFKVQGSKFKVGYVLALLFFVLGLLSKPMVVTLPFVLLLIDWWMAESGEKSQSIFALPWGRWLLEKIPFFALSAASCVITYIAQKHGNAMEVPGHLPVWDRIGNASVAYVRYLEKMFWPVDLAVFYPHPGFWSNRLVLGSLAVLIIITAIVIRFRQGRPWLAAGWFWFLGTLVPVIGLVQVGRQAMADRYAYIPLIGIFIIVSWGLGEWAERRKQTGAAAGLSMAALAGCMAITWVQVGYWKNSETLFKHDIGVAGYNYIACYNLGIFFLNDRPAEAAFYLEHAPIENPSDVPDRDMKLALAHFNAGVDLMSRGDFESAEKHLAQSAKIESTNADYHLALGMALLKEQKNDDALTELTAALRRDPHNPKTHAQLATLLMRRQKATEAAEQFAEAVRLYRARLEQSPDSPALLNNLAWLLATTPFDNVRNGADAVTFARKSCDITQGQSALSLRSLSAAYAESGRYEEATASAQKAREIALQNGEKEVALQAEDLLKAGQAHQAYREK